MTEDQFTDDLLVALNLQLPGCHVGRKVSLLYELSIAENGVVVMGVDTDSGTPLRGRGKGFEQDILIYQLAEDGHTSVVPRVIAEVKFGSVTTHDAIVYSEKANRIRRIYPYVRYGLILGGFSWLPGRVIRLGPEFDFMCAVAYPFEQDQIEQLKLTLQSELMTALGLADVLAGRRKVTLLHRSLVVSKYLAR